MKILDSSNTCTVVCKLWLEVFLDKKSDGIFLFGDGVTIKYSKVVKFPVILVSMRAIGVYIEADIVKNNLPLLLIHKSMKTIE